MVAYDKNGIKIMFHFGKDRQGNTQNLQEIAKNFGIQVIITNQYLFDQDRISSSRIRQALLDGNVAIATELLGRPYQIIGKVIYGNQLGRTIGFPTANIEYPPDKFLPKFGVYVVKVKIDDNLVNGVMNVGLRPTIGDVLPTVEVHLLDWHRDIYGRTITIKLLEFLRGEQRFPDLIALQNQIAIDCENARKWLIVNS